ncbi:MAG TPA: PAS domain S-box protein [Polaromonas sp.]|nr:PAS domain S-box protein [Polaromonas sp.]
MQDSIQQMQDELQQQVVDWQQLHALSQKILRSTTVHEQLSLVLKAVADFVRCEKGIVSLYDGMQNGLVTQTSLGLSEPSLAQLACIAIGDGACGLAYQDRRQVVVADTETDPLYAKYREFARQEKIRAVISTPISKSNGDPLGVLSVYLEDARRLDAREARLLDICVSYIGPLIERAAVESELRREQDWSRQLLESIGEGLIVMDRNFRVLQINTEGLRITGYRHPSDVVGKIHWDAWPDTENLESGKAYKRVMNERVAIALEQRYPVDGRDVWFDVHAYPTGDGIAVLFRDITDKVLSTRTLMESERRLHLLANTIPQLAWMANPDGHIHWYNDRWYEYTGKRFEDLEGWGWQSVHHPDAVDAVTERWKESIATGETFQMTFPLLGADGKFRPFFTLVSPLRDASGRITQWFGSNTDVSPLREAEQALRNSEERLQEGLSAGQLAVWEWDLETDRIEFSVNAPVLFGESWDTATEAFSRVHPDDLPSLRTEVEAAVPQLGQFRRVVRMIRPDNGALIWIDFRGKVIKGDGSFNVVRGICIDVSERVRAEDNLTLANRRKDEFLAMLAHELRNPLAPISTAAQLLLRAGVSEDRVRRSSEIITRQVNHMTSLVDDLLDVSRVTRGLVSLHPEAVDVKAVVHSAVEQIRPLIESRHHTLTVQLTAEPSFVMGDRTRLVQILANLLNNAAKYTPQGGEVDLTATVEGGKVRLSVTDNGTGIAEEFLPHVFDLFAQGERTPDRSQGGLGLGLSLVKSLMALHSGDVAATSAGLGKGSTFTLTLPRIAAPASPGAQSVAPNEQGGRPLSLLVVDDNADAAQTLGDFLEAVGHQVIVVNDANAALTAYTTHSFDALILDIGLPDINGYELARRIKAMPKDASPALIALTGYGQEHDKVLSRAAGFDFHFVKPVDSEELVSTLDHLS